MHVLGVCVSSCLVVYLSICPFVYLSVCLVVTDYLSVYHYKQRINIMNKSKYIDTGPGPYIQAVDPGSNIPCLMYNIYNWADINITNSDKIYVKLTIKNLFNLNFPNGISSFKS